MLFSLFLHPLILLSLQRILRTITRWQQHWARRLKLHEEVSSKNRSGLARLDCLRCLTLSASHLERANLGRCGESLLYSDAHEPQKLSLFTEWICCR